MSIGGTEISLELHVDGVWQVWKEARRYKRSCTVTRRWFTSSTTVGHHIWSFGSVRNLLIGLSCALTMLYMD